MIFIVYGVVPGIPAWLHVVLVVVCVATQLLPFIIGRLSGDEQPSVPESGTSFPWTQVPVSFASAFLVSAISVVGTCASVFLLCKKVWGCSDAEGAQRAAEASRKLQKLPLQEFCTRDQLMGKSLSQLKEIRQRLTEDEPEFTDKKDVVDALLASGGSSACTCAICFEDYQEGDVMRVMPCLHRFHESCIDQWILQQARRQHNTAHSVVAYECPLCHARL